MFLCWKHSAIISSATWAICCIWSGSNSGTQPTKIPYPTRQGIPLHLVPVNLRQYIRRQHQHSIIARIADIQVAIPAEHDKLRVIQILSARRSGSADAIVIGDACCKAAELPEHPIGSRVTIVGEVQNAIV